MRHGINCRVCARLVAVEATLRAKTITQMQGIMGFIFSLQSLWCNARVGCGAGGEGAVAAVDVSHRGFWQLLPSSSFHTFVIAGAEL